MARREPAHCDGAASYNYAVYPTRDVGDSGVRIKAVQCLLSGRGLYSGAVDGVYDAGLGAAVSRWRVDRGLPAGTAMTARAWTALLAQGSTPLLKYGAASAAVRRLQRALNAADGAGLAVTGVFEGTTTAAVKTYQRDHGLTPHGVAGSGVWARLVAGTR